MDMSKGLALVLVFAFIASNITLTKPVWAASVVGNSWAEKAPMHVARGGLGVAAVNGKIYAIGGSTQEISNALYVGGGLTGINEEYDPATDNWTIKKPMPTPRAFFAIIVYQNKIYCIGGNAGPTGVNEVYNPATDTWQTKAPMPTARYGLQGNVVNGKIYLIGGYPSGPINEVYDPATDSWTTKSSMPSDTTYYGSAVFDNKIYVVGGYPAGKLNQIYDPENDNWSLGASSPYGVVGAAVATVGVMAPRRIYVLSNGGTNQIYDPKNDSWMVGAEIPTDRIKFSAAVVNDMLYVMGGIIENFTYPYSTTIYNDTPIAVNEQYTPIGYGTPDPSYVPPTETAPPKISVLSPVNQTYNESSVSFLFTVDKLVNWTGYSLDGQDNVTVTGNTTLTGLSNGLHNITVYAEDTFGNIGASETIAFTIASAPFPTVPVAAASVASVAVAGVGLLIYFRKRRH